MLKLYGNQKPSADYCLLVSVLVPLIGAGAHTGLMRIYKGSDSCNPGGFTFPIKQ